MEWPACLDEYQKLVNRMNNPRVVIDNAVCATATLVKVDSARKHRILLEAIQVLTDLNLSITKAYISSDGQWFMDVFHVTDQHGHKLTDTSLLSYIEQSLDNSAPSKPTTFTEGLTVLELTGTDRPGLLSEVFAVLSDLECGVVDAKVWTHNGRIASLISVKDESSGAAIEDPVKLHRVEIRLCNVLRRDNDVRSAKTEVSSMDVTHVERRLHQMMFADRDYEQMPTAAASESPQTVMVQNWVDRGYSIVNVQCLDRPKLLFDIVCTLTDMKYVVFHGTIDTDGEQARQEFYIRHADGSPISSEAERQRVIQCLQAAIERRASQGVRLELCMMDRQRLLSDVTRTFRENGLSVARAEISTVGEMASNVFFVTDAAGNPVDSKTIEAVRQRIGTGFLQVREPLLSACYKSTRAREEGGGGGAAGLFSIGSLVRRNLYNLGLIRSCS